MRKTQTTRTLVVVAALLLLSLALAFAGDADRVEIEGVEKQVVVLDGGGEKIVLHLDDLKDGESREFKGNHGTVTVTRRGDSLEVTSESELEGDHRVERKVFVTAGSDAQGNVVIHKRDGSGEPHVYAVRVGGDGDAHWTTTEGEDVHLEILGDAEELADAPGHARGHVIVHRDGEGTRTFSFVGDDGQLMWVGEGDGAVYRCGEDEVVVSGPAEKLGNAVVTCPVCGKTMTKVEKEGPHFMKMRVTTDKDSPDTK